MAEHTNEIIDTHAEVQQNAADTAELPLLEVEEEAEFSIPAGKHTMPTANFAWDHWSHIRRELGQDSQREFEGSRAKLKEATAMLAIEIANRHGYDWAREAADLMRDIPNSGHTYMAATVATFGAHASDDKAKKARSSFLDRMALAVEWLVAQVTAKLDGYPADQIGTVALIKLIDDKGGMSKIAGLQRDQSSRQETSALWTAKIALDPEAVRLERLERALKELERNAPSETAVVKLGFIYEDGSSKSVGATLAASDDRLEQALLDMNVVDPLVDRLGELLHAGQMVAEDETTVLVDPLDDPEDPEEGFRKAFRHFVFADGSPIVISPILVSASVVVQATPNTPLFSQPLDTPCHLRTRERRIMEANIADPERRKVFSAKVADAGKTSGVCRFVVETAAAADKEQNGRNVGALVEPLRSARSNLPLAVDLARFTSRIKGHISLTAWRSRYNDFVVKATKPTGKSAEARQKHSLNASSWKIASSKKDDERDMVGNGVATDVEVMTGDFYRVSQVITSLPVVGQITVRAERHTGLCIDFSTKHFSYEVYIPAVTTGGDRTTALVAPFKLPDCE